MNQSNRDNWLISVGIVPEEGDAITLAFTNGAHRNETELYVLLTLDEAKAAARLLESVCNAVED